MILIAAAAVWFVVFIGLSFTPRLTPEARRNAQLDLLCLGGLGLATAGFFWQILFTASAWMPAGGGDLAGFIYPTYHFAQEWLARGVIPLWNPYIFGGMPFVGDIQTAIFYPLNLLTYLLSNPIAYGDLEYLSILHYYIAGAGMFALLRFGPLTPGGSKLNRFACLTGAVAFAFSDLFITHFGNLNLIATAAWLPLIFLFFARSIENTAPNIERDNADPDKGESKIRPLLNRRSASFALICAAFLALSFFAGHIQPYLFSVLVLAVYAGYVAVLDRTAWARVALVFLITIAAAVGLSAITLLPAVELSQLSVRRGFTYADAAQFSLPPIELVGLVVPGFFGRGPQNAWGPWPRVEVGYLGIFPLLLAFLAIILRRNARTMFFALLALLGLLLALGGYSIFHGWLYQFVPGFGSLRAPARFVFVLDFALAVLAAIGFDALVSPMTDAGRALYQKTIRYAGALAILFAVAAGGLALGILILGQGQDPILFQRIANAANAIGFFILLLGLSFALLLIRARGLLSARLWSVLAVALVFFDLFSLGAYVDIGPSDPVQAYSRPDVTEFLKANTGLARIDSRTDVEGSWRPDTGLLVRLQDVYGDNPLVLNIWNEYWESLDGRSSSNYGLLNIKYALVREGTPLPPTFQPAFKGGGGISVYENTCTVPRAWVVYNSYVEANSQNTLRALTGDCLVPDPRVAPGITISVSGDGAREIRNTDFLGTDSIEITAYGPNEISGRLNARFDGFAFFSEVFVPGWKAFVDGQEVPVVRANYLFRAVPVTSGEHQVRLVYDPLSFRIGAIVSILTLVVVVGLLVWSLLRR